MRNLRNNVSTLILSVILFLSLKLPAQQVDQAVISAIDSIEYDYFLRLDETSTNPRPNLISQTQAGY